MLTHLSIRDFVLIEKLDLEFGTGFTALTGETGAGKSILLGALNMALGQKVSKNIIRNGKDKASVSAAFELADSHPAYSLLQARDLDIESGEALVLRRSVARDGKARAFLNDRVISADLLGQLSEFLVEIHAQHGATSLLNPARHRAILDDFGRYESLIEDLKEAYLSWKASDEALKDFRQELAKAEDDREYLKSALEELEALAPETDEETRLATERAQLQNAEKMAVALGEAVGLFEDMQLERHLGQIARILSASTDGQTSVNLETSLSEAITQAMEANERALIEVGEAYAATQMAQRAAYYDPKTLDDTEERLFALRSLARKHNVTIDELDALHDTMLRRYEAIEFGDEKLADLAKKEAEARKAWQIVADKVSIARREAADRFKKEVMAELKPLKLEKAAIQATLVLLNLDTPSAHGQEQVLFEVSTNAGAPFGPLGKIASGGELARFALAMKVVLAEEGSASLLFFDEADQGVGGAVATAIGSRLRKLSDKSGKRQVLAVTHSPQVAAEAHTHWRISKSESAGATTSQLVSLSDETAKIDELARMLAGAEITEEARAAARKLRAANT